MPASEQESLAPVALDMAALAAEATFLGVRHWPRRPAWLAIAETALVNALAAVSTDDDVPSVLLRTVAGDEIAVSAESIADTLGVLKQWRAYQDGKPDALDQVVEGRGAPLLAVRAGHDTTPTTAPARGDG